MATGTQINNLPNTPEIRYAKMYRTTVILVSSAKAKFSVLAEDSSTVQKRSDARARKLQAEQELHLMEELYDAWMGGTAAINPPTKQQLDNTIALADQLAQITATESKFNSIVTIFTQAATAFNTIHGKPVPAPPQAT